MQGGRQANWLQSKLAELTNPATSVVSAPRVSFSLSGWACLACGFSSLFSPWGTVSVPGCGCSATCRFGRGGQSGTLLFFSLNVSRSHLVCPGEGFSITPLWADQRKQERRVWYLGVNIEIESKTKAHSSANRCTNGHADKQRGELIIMRDDVWFVSLQQLFLYHNIRLGISQIKCTH